MTKNVTKLTRGILAAALVATLGVSMGGAFAKTEVADLSRPDAIKLSRPLNDAGDAEVRNIPIVGGSYN